MKKRNRTPGSRRETAERKRREKLARLHELHSTPGNRVLQLRGEFHFVHPTKGPDGRQGTIDQDICDGIGQLHALGLLDGHGHDPQDMRDYAREWGHGYAMLLKGLSVKTSSYERMDKGVRAIAYTAKDARFDRMDVALDDPYARSALLSLIVDPLIGDFDGDPVVPWAKSLIDEALLKRGVVRPLIRFPDSHDRGLFEAAVRGCLQLVDAGIPARHERQAA